MSTKETVELEAAETAAQPEEQETALESLASIWTVLAIGLFVMT